MLYPKELRVLSRTTASVTFLARELGPRTVAASKAVTASEDGAGDEDVPIQGPRAGAVCVCVGLHRWTPQIMVLVR